MPGTHCLGGSDAGVGEGAHAGLPELVDGGALGGGALEEAQHAILEDSQRLQQRPRRPRVFPRRWEVP